MTFESWSAAVQGLSQRLDDDDDDDEGRRYSDELLSELACVDALAPQLQQQIVRWLRARVERQIVEQIAPMFWSAVGGDRPHAFVDGVVQVRRYHTRLQLLLRRGFGDADWLWQPLSQLLDAAVFSDRWSSLSPLLSRFFHRRFAAFARQHSSSEDFFPPASDDEEKDDDDDDDDEDDEACGCGMQVSECQCAERVVRSLGRLAEEVCVELCCARIQSTVEKQCRGRFHRRVLGALVAWCRQVPVRWLGELFAGSAAALEERVLGELYGHFFSVRSGELFDVIVDMPESAPAIEDLRDCLRRCDAARQQQQMIGALCEAFNTRLLHCGVNTADILTQYISTIKAFRILDPSGQALAVVSQPLKAYLVKRSDTARQIVASLTDSQSPLYRELLSSHRSSQHVVVDSSSSSSSTTTTTTTTTTGDSESGAMDKITLQELVDDDGGGEEALAVHEHWKPAPPPGDAVLSTRDGDDGDGSGGSQVVIDVIHTLVSVYGSKELFVKEYKRLLADRLLHNTTFDTDQDDQTLELLKLRFGEAALEDCVVMLRDIYDSKLINKHLQTSARLPATLRALIISGLYWPKMKPEEFNHPPDVARLVKDFEAAYEAHKHLRKLEWVHQVGTVELALDFDDGRHLSLAVEPLHAAVIAPFANSDDDDDDHAAGSGLALSRVAEQVGISESRTRKALAFWIKKGVLFESATDVYQVIEDEDEHRRRVAQRSSSSASSSAAASSSTASDESDKPSSSSSSSAAVSFTEDELLAQAFVQNMLRSNGALPLETIHSRLGMFLPDFEVTLVQLKQFLQRLILTDRIELSMDGLYTIK